METLLLAFGLGLAAGFSPGPLLTLVVSTALERGFAAGVRVAAAPLLTDAPVIVLSILVLAELPAAFLDGLTLAGGVFVVWLGIDSLRATLGTSGGLTVEQAAEAAAGAPPQDLWRGFLVNILSPHPWLFWVTIGGPELVRSWVLSPWRAVGFIAVFYLLLVGSKVLIAGVAARGRRLLRGRWYGRVLAVLGAALVVLGALLVVRGAVGLFGVTCPAPLS